MAKLPTGRRSPSPSSSRVGLHRLFPVLVGATALILFIVFVAKLGPLHILGVSVGVFAFALAFCAVAYGSARRAKVLYAVMVLGLAVAVWGSLPAGPTGASSPKPPPAPPTNVLSPTHPPLAVLGQPIALGVNPRELVKAGNGLWALTDAGIAHLDPRASSNVPEAFAVPGMLAYLAADDSHLVVVREGWALLYGIGSERLIDKVHFSEAAGPAAVGFGAAWLCNATHSKLDRWDLRTHMLTSIEMPGVPISVLVAGNSVWVGLESGWIVHVNPSDDAVTTHFRTEKDPLALAWEAGSLWIAHPDIRRVTHMDLATGKQSAPIAVAANTDKLLASSGYIWAISNSLDLLEQIDPHDQKVRYMGLAPAPSGLVEFAGELFVTSESDGTLIPLTTTPAAKPR